MMLRLCQVKHQMGVSGGHCATNIWHGKSSGLVHGDGAQQIANSILVLQQRYLHASVVQPEFRIQCSQLFPCFLSQEVIGVIPLKCSSTCGSPFPVSQKLVSNQDFEIKHMLLRKETTVRATKWFEYTKIWPSADTFTVVPIFASKLFICWTWFDLMRTSQCATICICCILNCWRRRMVRLPWSPIIASESPESTQRDAVHRCSQHDLHGCIFRHDRTNNNLYLHNQCSTLCPFRSTYQQMARSDNVGTWWGIRMNDIPVYYTLSVGILYFSFWVDPVFCLWPFLGSAAPFSQGI